MKIRFSTLMVLVAVLLGGVFASCAPEEITKVSAKMSLENADELGAIALTFSNRAETKSVSFTADGDWYIRIPKDCNWLKASPASGSGNATVNFTTSLYEEEVPRDAKVAFVCDGLEQKAILNVTQLQKFILDVTVDNPVLGKTGGEFTFPVSTNGTYDVNITIGEGSDANWLTCVSSTNNEITFNAAAIQGKRNAATVTLTCKEDPSTVYQFELSQKNLQLSFTHPEVHIKGEIATADLPVDVINITNWNAASTADWCAVQTASGKVVATMGQNTTGAVRKATINLSTPEDAEMKSSISLIQYPSGVITPDLCNIVYDENGNATDISPKASAVEYLAGEGKVVSWAYYEQYGRYAPSFATTPGSSYNGAKKIGYYVDYTSWQTPFNDGYTIEAVFSIPVEHNNAETKAFGGTGSGGFAIMLGNSSRGRSIEFIQHNGSAWCFGSTGIIPVPGQFYHVIGVYDPSTKKIYTYVDGELKADVACTGIKHMNTTEKKIAVGINHKNADSNGSWNGTVVVSRVYDAVMTPEQVKAATAAVNMPAELYSRDIFFK